MALPGETEIIAAQIYEEPIAPHLIEPSVTPNLVRLILRALAKAPADRQQTMEQLKGELDLVTSGRFASGAPVTITTTEARAAVPRRSGPMVPILVGVLLVVNAVLSFMQEHRAAGVVETLRRRLQVSARVLREGIWQVIPARDLVPGDIVRVRPGDIIPADVKLLTGALSVDQSALTGESQDADKAPGDVLSSGSVVRRGEGNGVVMLTGAKTYFGRTTELVQQARPKLHIEAVVVKVVRWLFVIVGALLGVVIVLSLIRGAPLGPAGDAATHRTVIQEALAVLTTATEPGTIVDSTRTWRR